MVLAETFTEEQCHMCTVEDVHTFLGLGGYDHVEHCNIIKRV